MRSVVTLIFLASAQAASACPFCNSQTAKQIRAALFGPDLLYNVFITILPFLVCGIVVYLIYRGGFSTKNLKIDQ